VRTDVGTRRWRARDCFAIARRSKYATRELCHFKEVKVSELGIGFPVESAAEPLEVSPSAAS
jgi:hypothetical protein